VKGGCVILKRQQRKEGGSNDSAGGWIARHDCTGRGYIASSIAGRFALTAGRYTLTAGRSALTAGRYALTAGRYTLTAGRSALTAGAGRCSYRRPLYICDGFLSEKKDLSTNTCPRPTVNMATVTNTLQIIILSFKSSPRLRPCVSRSL